MGARDVLGDSQASRYHELFTARRTLLEKSIRRAGVLPLTVNHCDLRPQNTAFSKDGTCLIFDWDEVVAGPAGLSLHNSFGGCCVPSLRRSLQRTIATYCGDTLYPSSFKNPAILLGPISGWAFLCSRIASDLDIGSCFFLGISFLFKNRFLNLPRY